MFSIDLMSDYQSANINNVIFTLLTVLMSSSVIEENLRENSEKEITKSSTDIN